MYIYFKNAQRSNGSWCSARDVFINTDHIESVQPEEKLIVINMVRFRYKIYRENNAEPLEELMKVLQNQQIPKI